MEMLFFDKWPFASLQLRLGEFFPCVTTATVTQTERMRMRTRTLDLICSQMPNAVPIMLVLSFYETNLFIVSASFKPVQAPPPQRKAINDSFDRACDEKVCEKREVHNVYIAKLPLPCKKPKQTANRLQLFRFCVKTVKSHWGKKTRETGDCFSVHFLVSNRKRARKRNLTEPYLNVYQMLINHVALDLT